MTELDELKKKIQRLEFIIAHNSKRLKALRPILRNLAKHIGENSSDIRKIIDGLYKYMDMDLGSKKEYIPPDMNNDCKGSYI